VSPQLIALTIISAIVVIGSVIAFMARFRHAMDLEQWTVAGRGFGLVLVWLLMAGEIFTVFTFLGGSGWAYSKGGPVLYILGYAPLACVVAFYILPAIWEAGRQHKLQTQADFFHVRYGNKYLGALVAFVGVACLIPYVQMQLVGLGLIVEVASFGAIHRTTAMIVAFTLVAGFVLVSGVRGVAWVSILKDALLLFGAVFLGVAIPRIYFGGIGPMFTALANANPQHLMMPGATRNLGHSWFISTVLLTSLTFYMWPHYFAATFTAKGSKVLRRNAMLMPFYIVAMPLIIFVGFTAVLVLPGLPNGDLSLLLLVQKTFPVWFLGFIGGAGALTAMVPSAIQLLAGATLYSKNLYRPLFAPAMTDQEVARLAKIMVVVLTLGALLLAIYTSPSLVSLLLLGFIGVSQLFPGVVLGLFSNRVTTAGVFAGLVTGIAAGVSLVLTGRDPYNGLNAGFLALSLNFAVTGTVSALTRVTTNGFTDRAQEIAMAAAQAD
jgi:SSS family solute:Na+ symporter